MCTNEKRCRFYFTASSKDELYESFNHHKGEHDPYSMVSGIVRMVAVDRWMNELVCEGKVVPVKIGKDLFAKVNDHL